MGALMNPEHSWPVPPEGGWTADDLDTLPNLPPHTELIDGSLVFVSPQTRFHMRAVNFFDRQLDSLVPEGLEVLREFTIDIDRRNRPEPDVIVCREDVVDDWAQTRLPAETVLLAIEVVSPESVDRDRETKPLKYARAGIPHYWRVENKDGRAVVYVFEREPAGGGYVATGIFHDRLKVSVPFSIDLDLTAITAKRTRPE
ncbi:Uma2 family endonuclease [Streptomyces sp. NPDC060334]|uniref:Uma2 family endonuclease n=1 Tax=unclassified Streptomyces TaxID=2593676 RepID=UPI000D14BD4A|nr:MULTISPECIES: Uma2 family endonuclease [unclassified Streptomyces]MCX5073949.1 Uma2 family endonuclease [Streptomyces sp. NBC_00424]MCX5154490.1 Uma2 family endonuclease [Streptomyces sp. NBC_00291]WUD42836.1 Uma2 family endonuclease [Streptomyces sp. NBC_00513]